jgi:hypothetical protein
MKLTLLRTAILPLSLCFCCTAATAASGIVIDLTDVHLSLISSTSGFELPITPVETWRVAEWSLDTQVRTGDRVDQHTAYQQHADYVQNLPAQIGSALDNGAAIASMQPLFGNVHMATALGPFPEVHEAMVRGGWNAQFYLPAQSQLTMSGHVSIQTVGEPYNPFASFSSGFYSSVYFLPSVLVDLQRSDQAELDFTLTAVNPFNQELEYQYSTALFATSVALASPIPEPPMAAMLAAGLLLGGWRIRSSAASPHAGPGTCRRGPCTRSRRPHRSRRKAPARSLRRRRSWPAAAWCSRTPASHSLPTQARKA